MTGVQAVGQGTECHARVPGHPEDVLDAVRVHHPAYAQGSDDVVLLNKVMMIISAHVHQLLLMPATIISTMHRPIVQSGCARW